VNGSRPGYGSPAPGPSRRIRPANPADHPSPDVC
jgi:hypothetical protein